jgi:hypothetical protein
MLTPESLEITLVKLMIEMLNEITENLESQILMTRSMIDAFNNKIQRSQPEDTSGSILSSIHLIRQQLKALEGDLDSSFRPGQPGIKPDLNL